MKEQEKSPEKELSEMKVSNLPNMEFKMMVIRVLKLLRRRTEELTEYLKKEIVSIKKHK